MTVLTNFTPFTIVEMKKFYRLTLETKKILFFVPKILMNDIVFPFLLRNEFEKSMMSDSY